MSYQSSHTDSYSLVGGDDLANGNTPNSNNPQSPPHAVPTSIHTRFITEGHGTYMQDGGPNFNLLEGYHADASSKLLSELLRPDVRVFCFLSLWSRGWKERFLSAAGREVLIKSVGQAIPNIMQTFLLPNRFCDYLRSMELLVGSAWGEHKQHWCSWQLPPEG